MRMGTRPRNRKHNHQYLLYADISIGESKVIRCVSQDDGYAMVRSGSADPLFDEGGLLRGFQLCEPKADQVGAHCSVQTKVCITARDAQLNAGTSFLRGRSRTEIYPEEWRARLKYPEDIVERAVVKVRVWREIGDARAVRAS